MKKVKSVTNNAGQTSVNPLEVDLVFGLKPCQTCGFFWPKAPAPQPYGPYPAFDFTTNFPQGNEPDNQSDYSWLNGLTTAESFPNGEVMDGCRKAPIMTIGINPNLTAFAPGLQGTSWAYPNFTNDNGTNEFAKYAYYYRYRSVYQEHLDINLVKKYLLPDGQIIAPKSGIVKKAKRTSADPNYNIQVLYDGDTSETTIQLQSTLGTPRYVLLFDYFPPNNRFNAEDIIAAKLDIPAGVTVEVFQETIGYYEQIVPVLQQFSAFLKTKVSMANDLQDGEDVGQLDMVACASPHWSQDYLGNQETQIIQNCVSTNAWAIKQLVQTKPAILFLVGESTFNMFYSAFGKLLVQKVPLPAKPVDGAFTLFKDSADPNNPCYLQFETTIDGIEYSLSTQIIVTPHFSYNNNFIPQFRMSETDWISFQNNFNSCYLFLKQDDRVQITEGSSTQFAAIEIVKNLAGFMNDLQTHYNDAYQVLLPTFYDVHTGMSDALINLYNQGKLTYTPPANGSNGFLTRADGPCSFCDNQLWSFPLACPYGKTKEPAPPAGFLEAVAAQMVLKGKTKLRAHNTLYQESNL